MSVGSISFWQQDQNFLARNQQQSQTQSTSAALIGAMGSAVTSRTQGLSSLANQTALNRTNTALTAAIQAELQQTQSGSSSSSAGSSSSSSSGSSTSTAPAVATPATGTGTVPLTRGTLLMTLGIPPNNAITVSDGTNTTTFASTGTDTVGDLINTINNTTNAKNAAASAYLNSSGNLVITANNTTDSINVGGLFAQNVGFSPNNQSFSPVAPAASTSSSSSASPSGTPSSSSSSSATSSSSSSGSSTSSSSGTSSSTAASAYSGLFNSSLALQTGGTAEFLLAANGSSGTTLNLLT
jgi:outer membrane lipoprotein-sorting protein